MQEVSGRHFPLAQLVTYHYFTGRLSMLSSQFARAERQLTFAFDKCPASAFKNKRLILRYLGTRRGAQNASKQRGREKLRKAAEADPASAAAQQLKAHRNADAADAKVRREKEHKAAEADPAGAAAQQLQARREKQGRYSAEPGSRRRAKLPRPTPLLLLQS